MEEHNYALENANTCPRLQRRMQNICFVISISAVILKLMVKITSISSSYRFLRIAWHYIFSLSKSKSKCFLMPGRVKGPLNPIPKLTKTVLLRVLNLVRPLTLLQKIYPTELLKNGTEHSYKKWRSALWLNAMHSGKKTSDELRIGPTLYFSLKS